MSVEHESTFATTKGSSFQNALYCCHLQDPAELLLRRACFNSTFNSVQPHPRIFSFVAIGACVRHDCYCLTQQLSIEPLSYSSATAVAPKCILAQRLWRLPCSICVLYH